MWKSKAQIYQNAPSKKVALTLLNKEDSKAFRKFAPDQKPNQIKNQINMKYLFITALAACISTAAFAQEKKEATVKIVINENGKERVIEKKFSDLDQADAELKKFSDSLDMNISTSGGKKKIVRVDVNKSHARMSDQPGKLIIENIDGGQEKRVIIRKGMQEGDLISENFMGAGPQENKRVMIIRKGDKDGNIISEDIKGPEGFTLELDRPGNRMKAFRKIHKNVLGEGSKTIQGLHITPNKPFNGKLNIKFNAPEKGTVSISILDVNGKELANEQIKDSQGDYLGQIEMKKAVAGVYFVRVTQGTDGAVRRVKVD